MSIQEDPIAWGIIRATAANYGVTTEAIMAPVAVRGHQRAPVLTAARRAAITVLANETIDGIYRFPIVQIAQWFGVSRVSIYKQRKRSGDYVRRQGVSA